MEVDEIQRQVTKYQRVSSNGSTTTTENSSNPQKIPTGRTVDDGGGAGGGVGGGGGGGIDMVGGGGVARLCGWPASRIVRVSRASGGKDRHSKVLTSKGLRDRRVRLSVGTAIQFYDLQDRLGYDQPSKAVEWLLKAAASSIDELPSLDLPIVPIAGAISDLHHIHQMTVEKNRNCNNDNNGSQMTKSPSCSSTSETSKGSGLSLSRSENRMKARERARGVTASRMEKKEIDSTGVTVLNQVNSISENSSFTDLLTGGTTTVRSPMEYYFNRPPQTSTQLFQLPQFNLTSGDNNNLHHFSFLQDNLNFSMTSSPSSSGVVAPGGYTRGTLQSNLPSTIMPHHHHHHHLQRFQSSGIEGSTPTNLPFFFVPNANVDHFAAATGGYHLSYGGGGDGSGRHSDHHKEKSKN